jgi:hypothetical protein
MFIMKAKAFYIYIFGIGLRYVWNITTTKKYVDKRTFELSFDFNAVFFWNENCFFFSLFSCFCSRLSFSFSMPPPTMTYTRYTARYRSFLYFVYFEWEHCELWRWSKNKENLRFSLVRKFSSTNHIMNDVICCVLV